MKQTARRMIIMVMAVVLCLSANMPVMAQGSKEHFDYIGYANTYPDLKAVFGYNLDALYNHYMLCGQAEGRIGIFEESISNKNVSRIGNVFVIDGVAIPTTNEYRIEEGITTLHGKLPDKIVGGGYPIVIEKGAYEEVSFLQDCFMLFTDEEKLAAINFANEPNRKTHVTSNMVSWIMGTDILTQEQKIAYLRNNPVVDQVGFGDKGLTLNSLNWWWVNIGSVLQNGQLTQYDIAMAERYFEKLGVELVTVSIPGKSQYGFYKVTKADYDRWMANGWITMVESQMSIGDGVNYVTGKVVKPYIIPSKFILDCMSWSIVK